MNTVTTLKEEFPFDEVRDANGDYFDTVGEAMDAGFDLNQVWSVTEEDHEIVYGPSRHYINRLGYTATAERHDESTYYIYDYSEEFADS